MKIQAVFDTIKKKFLFNIPVNRVGFASTYSTLRLERQIGPAQLKQYYRTNFILRRVLQNLSKSILTKSTHPELDSAASTICLNLLIYGFVVVRKSDNTILDPEFCEFLTKSRVDPRLYAIDYKHDQDDRVYSVDELAVVTLDTFGYFNPISLLEGISPELDAFQLSRQLMVKHMEKGANSKLALILDSDGMNPDQFTKERQSISESMLGEDNFGRPLVAFTKGAKGQIIELKNDFVSSEHIAFFEYITVAIATALGVPGDYVNQATKGSGLSDSRYKVTDFVYNQTVIALQTVVESVFKSLQIQYTLERPLTEVDRQLMLDNSQPVVVK